MDTATQTPFPDDESNDRLAGLMMRLEADQGFRLKPITVVERDNAHGHLLFCHATGGRTDLTAEEAHYLALLLRLERPYPAYDRVADKIDAAADLLDAMLWRAQRSLGFVELPTAARS